MAAGLGLISTLLTITRGRLGGGSRGLLRPLQPQHQLNQFFLRQTLQISAIHLPMDSGIAAADKGVGNYAQGHPTDAKLDLKALLALVRQAKRHGLKLRQAYTRLAKRAAVQVGRYAHARQMRRMQRELKRLKTYLGRVYRDVARKVSGDAGSLFGWLACSA